MTFTSEKIKNTKDFANMQNEFNTYILNNPEYNLLYNYTYINDFVEFSKSFNCFTNDFTFWSFVNGSNNPVLLRLFVIFLDCNNY